MVRWEWDKGPRGRVGFADCVLRVDGRAVTHGILRIEPRKLTLDQYSQMLDDIVQIAYNIVYDLQDTTFAHLELTEPGSVPKSGLEWLETIRSFVAPLSQALEGINRQPHVRILEQEEDQFIWEIQRPGPSLLRRVARASDRELVPDPLKRVPVLSNVLGGRVPVKLPGVTWLRKYGS